MARVSIEKVGEHATMEIVRDNGEVITLLLSELKEDIQTSGAVSVIHLEGREVPAE